MSNISMTLTRPAFLLLCSLLSWSCSDPPSGTRDRDTGSSLTDAGADDASVDVARADAAPIQDAADTPDADAASDVGPAEPISAPTDTWTWVEFPDAVCGNGAATGIGVNLTDRSDDLFVYFMGGGACWDVNSCFVLKSAANIETGYREANFDVDPVLGATAFDRADPSNPLRDMNWIFVPYCTGDLHAGDRVKRYEALGQTRDIHHVGGRNVAAFLRRLAPTFAEVPRVFVSGSSAGGYAAQLNAHRFFEAFPDAEVHVLSDSGPLVQPYAGRFGEMKAAWDLQVPADCAACGSSFPQWFDYLVDSHTTSRFGLLSYDADQVIHAYFAYPVGTSFHDALAGFVSTHYTPRENAHVFMLPGTEHVLLGGLTTIEAGDGTTLSAWIGRWIAGDPGWSSLAP